MEALIREKLSQLSPGQKKVAEFLLMKPEQSAFLTAAQLGREADVSEATVIRLSYALGFNGFPDMQARIQQQVLKKEGLSVLEQETEADSLEKEKSLFASVLDRDVAIVRQLATSINEADIWQAVHWLSEADQVLVAGFRASYGAAHWFSFVLSQCRGHVQLLQGAGDMPEKISTLTDRSVVFILSYPRYSRDAVQTAECAKNQGVRIIAATDRPLSPLGQLADLTFTTEENLTSMFSSNTGLQSLLNLIMVGMTTKNKEHVQARSQTLERLYTTQGIFVE
ncbi:UNVERIFIED_CONTAM: DNA-binding MurR/RpiR family transcriptional regulator [Brevibacillus sp. OAP136]